LAMGALAEVFGLEPPILGAALGIVVLWVYIWPKRNNTINHLKRLG